MFHGFNFALIKTLCPVKGGGNPAPPATVLIWKLKKNIFEEAVHRDDLFAHTGGDGDDGFLSGGGGWPKIMVESRGKHASYSALK